MSDFDRLLFVPPNRERMVIEFTAECLADGTYRVTLTSDHSYYYGDTPFQAIENAASEYDRLWRERQKGTGDDSL